MKVFVDGKPMTVPGINDPSLLDTCDSVLLHKHMTLRDYFAAQALVLYSNPEMQEATVEVAKERGLDLNQWIAMAIYELADAIMKERSK